MKRTIGCLAMLAVLAIMPRVARSDDAVPGIRGEFIGSMKDAGGKIEQLAAAMPEKKYTWRPGKGVRSVGEVYLHVCQANYLIPMLIGVTPPVSKDELMKMDTTPQTKAKTQQMLKDSYAFATKVITETTDADLDTPVTLFGMKMTKRAAIMIVVSHSHEHLGQSIAYARANGVVPPWTAAQQAEAAKKGKGGM
jgi:uncharacterized damage-inducible protein DinB